MDTGTQALPDDVQPPCGSRWCSRFDRSLARRRVGATGDRRRHDRVSRAGIDKLKEVCVADAIFSLLRAPCQAHNACKYVKLTTRRLIPAESLRIPTSSLTLWWIVE